jgi:hypothetical protein
MKISIARRPWFAGSTSVVLRFDLVSSDLFNPVQVKETKKGIFFDG